MWSSHALRFLLPLENSEFVFFLLHKMMTSQLWVLSCMILFSISTWERWVNIICSARNMLFLCYLLFAFKFVWNPWSLIPLLSFVLPLTRNSLDPCHMYEYFCQVISWEYLLTRIFLHSVAECRYRDFAKSHVSLVVILLLLVHNLKYQLEDSISIHPDAQIYVKFVGDSTTYTAFRNHFRKVRLTSLP